MYNCILCNNEQYIYYKDSQGYELARPCKCQKIRKSLLLAEKSGLGELLNIYTLDTYTTAETWQQAVKNNAIEYLKDKTNKWFTFLGESGIGKSHICTAICKELLKDNKEVVFMSWLQESGNLKRHINDIDFDECIDKYKNAEVLYIDDFFKANNNEPPTNADIKLANEIINYRYNKARTSNKTCKTIISSERTVMQLIDYDTAIAGRIVEMSKGFITEEKGFEKNYRLKGVL